jgi:hypothetical protein
MAKVERVMMVVAIFGVSCVYVDEVDARQKTTDGQWDLTSREQLECIYIH